MVLEIKPFFFFFGKLLLVALLGFFCLFVCKELYLDFLMRSQAILEAGQRSLSLIEIETAAAIKAAADLKSIETAKILADISLQNQAALNAISVPSYFSPATKHVFFSCLLACGFCLKLGPPFLKAFGFKYVIPLSLGKYFKVLTLGLSCLMPHDGQDVLVKFTLLDSICSDILLQDVVVDSMANSFKASFNADNIKILAARSNLIAQIIKGDADNDSDGSDL